MSHSHKKAQKTQKEGVAFVVFFLCFLCLFVAPECLARTRVSFNQHWQFRLGSAGQWRQLELPHDWSIEGEFSEKHPAGTGGGALPGGVGWYRKTFAVPLSVKGKQVYVEFDGVYRNSEVWINGHYLGKRPNGYISFQYELTGYIHSGEPNIILVKVDNQAQPGSRWYTGSGIYRHVRLRLAHAIHIG